MNIAFLVWCSIQYVNVVVFYDFAKAEINYWKCFKWNLCEENWLKSLLWKSLSFYSSLYSSFFFSIFFVHLFSKTKWYMTYCICVSSCSEALFCFYSGTKVQLFWITLKKTNKSYISHLSGTNEAKTCMQIIK